MIQPADRSGALVFFHGDGVGHALDPVVAAQWSQAAQRQGLHLLVCESALARRSRASLQPPWQLASLTQLWDAWLDAAPDHHGRPAFLLKIGTSGDARFNLELLELCLAGAALDADLAICFEAAAVSLLCGPTAAPWRQFPDFGLAALYHVADAVTQTDVPAQPLTREEVGRMVISAGRVIDV